MQNEIRGIEIKNVFWKIVFGWRYILMIGVLLAALLIGYKYNSDSDAYDMGKNLSDEVNASELKDIENIMSMYDRLNYFENYYEDSLITKLNPQEYYILELQYYVDSEYVFEIEQGSKRDYTPALVSAYGAYALNNEFAEALKNELNVDASIQSIRELTQISTATDSATVKLVVSVPNNWDAEEMESAIDKIMSEKSGELNSVGAHQLEKVNSAVNVTFSDSLEKKIYDTRYNINTVRQSIETYKAGLTDNQKVYLYNNIPYEEYKSEFFVAGPTEPSVNLKFGIVGFILGAFLVCAWYLIKEVFANKLQNEDDIQLVFGVNKLGSVEKKAATKKHFIFDRLLYKIKNKNNVLLSREDQLSYVASGIEIMCNTEQIDNIFLVGSCRKNADTETVTEIVAKLKSKGISCNAIDNIISDGEQLKNVVDTGYVVLTGEIDKSYYKHIEETIRVLHKYNVKILGTIIIV